ncbi:16S rRNA (uracil(1498)-N(3))-methyltransferase [Telmatocola sphagniphila]|uniref:Ribosomal RNA small subunit methyltransferase E n=1 Tax=Telmatocola sphagniphila TaxID=1123043 RepID=A0A8E6B6W1_9BACT|nr:16S rRNA (uracil(1498)-N(3))-methyltransferase [Telmatocola sphagniphila]QVL32462.1 16S rRNA (uracil(1498)-N(3))-methyltransferase [Telmatocola sphagniphila]
MSSRYFVETPLQAGSFSLEGPEAHHLLHVMRCEPGEKVTLFDGSGREAAATVQELHKKSALLQLDEPHYIDREIRFALHIAVAFPKADRSDFLVEKLTELGVTELTPLETERSVTKIRDDKLEKLHRQVIEASKQCGRNRLMKVNPSQNLQDFLTLPREGRRLLPHPGGKLLKDVAVPVGATTAVIGPEGGFSEVEVERARGLGWVPVSLGDRILRTETAAIALASRLVMDQ